jgi:tetratricopeptide (TPR) repeat protein
MLYKDLSLGGNVANYKKEDEVLRVRVEPRANSRMVQSFTINLDNVAPNSATLQLMWERTLVPIKITTEIDSRVMKNIESVMKVEDSRPYFQAASYYYENDKDLNQALTWVNKAVEQNRAFFVVHLKAKILNKMKDYNGAIAAAEESLSLAREAKNDDYIRLNEKLIAGARKAQGAKKS